MTLLLVLASLGIWFSRFPAETESVAGPPLELEVQDGVPRAEVEQVRAGLTAMDAYLRDEVGSAVSRPVQVRVSWSHGCKLFLGPKSAPVAWVDGRDFMCLNAAHPTWRDAVHRHGYFPAYVAAHEHVHNLQAQLGCYRDGDDHEWQWLFEGMAIELAYRALIAADLVTATDAELAIREHQGLQDGNGTLEDYERSSDAAGDAYGLFHLGARLALDEAGSPSAFATFCRADAEGVPWREAFETAFGIAVPAFYERVEAERVDLRTRYAAAG